MIGDRIEVGSNGLIVNGKKQPVNGAPIIKFDLFPNIFKKLIDGTQKEKRITVHL